MSDTSDESNQEASVPELLAIIREQGLSSSAVAVVFGIVERRLRGFALRLAHGDTSLADDLVQESFLRVTTRGLSGVKTEGELLALLRTALFNVYIDLWRRQRREDRATAKLITDAADRQRERGPSAMFTSDQLDAASRALRRTDPYCRKLLALKSIERLASNQASAELFSDEPTLSAEAGRKRVDRGLGPCKEQFLRLYKEEIGSEPERDGLSNLLLSALADQPCRLASCVLPLPSAAGSSVSVPTIIALPDELQLGGAHVEKEVTGAGFSLRLHGRVSDTAWVLIEFVDPEGAVLDTVEVTPRGSQLVVPAKIQGWKSIHAWNIAGLD